MATTEAEMRQKLARVLHRVLTEQNGTYTPSATNQYLSKAEVNEQAWSAYREAEAFEAQQAIKSADKLKSAEGGPFERLKREGTSGDRLTDTLASSWANPINKTPAGAAPDHGRDALDYATARAADGPTYRRWYELNPSEQQAIRQQSPNAKWPMLRWTLDRGRWVHAHDGHPSERSGDCPRCGHAISRHDPEDGTCDAPRADGQPGVCPCGREDRPVPDEQVDPSVTFHHWNRLTDEARKEIRQQQPHVTHWSYWWSRPSGGQWMKLSELRTVFPKPPRPIDRPKTPEEELESLRKFKEYVHERLDQMGVPADPKPTLTKLTGCRIGYRLDWVQGSGAVAVPAGWDGTGGGANPDRPTGRTLADAIADLQAGQINRSDLDYLELMRRRPLAPIESEEDLTRCRQMLADLTDGGSVAVVGAGSGTLSDGQRTYRDVLAMIVRTYEISRLRRVFPRNDPSPLAMLAKAAVAARACFGDGPVSDDFWADQNKKDRGTPDYVGQTADLIKAEVIADLDAALTAVAESGPHPLPADGKDPIEEALGFLVEYINLDQDKRQAELAAESHGQAVARLESIRAIEAAARQWGAIRRKMIIPGMTIAVERSSIDGMAYATLSRPAESCQPMEGGVVYHMRQTARMVFMGEDSERAASSARTAANQLADFLGINRPSGQMTKATPDLQPKPATETSPHWQTLLDTAMAVVESQKLSGSSYEGHRATCLYELAQAAEQAARHA